MTKTSISGARLIPRAALWPLVGALSALALASACSDDDDGNGGTGGTAGGGTGGTAGGGMGGTAGGGMSGTAGGGMGGTMAGSGGGMMGTGPTGTVEVLAEDPSFMAPTTAAIRGDDVFVTIAQFDDLFGGGTPMPDPFVAISVPLAGGALGDSISLPDDYYPEGITAADDGTLYIGSLTTGAIQRVPADSTTAEEFVAAGAVAERGVVGLTVDDDRDILWFCDSNPLAETPGAALVGVSTAAGTEGDEVVRHVLPDRAAEGDAGTGRAAFCNDAIVTPDGDILASESWSGKIYRVPAADVMTPDSAEVWSEAPELAPADLDNGFGVNGLDFVGDMLVIANAGLFAIDPASPDTAEAITLDAALEGDPDGLASVPGSTTELVVVDNAQPGRILKVTLDLGS